MHSVASSTFRQEIIQENQEAKDEKYEDKTVLGKIYFFIDYPCRWLLKLTIPPSEEDDYDNYLTVAFPVLGLVVNSMLITDGWPNSWWWLLCIPAACLWSAFYWKGERREAP